MRLIPIHQKEAEKGSFFGYVFYAIGLLTGCLAFGYAMFFIGKLMPDQSGENSFMVILVFVAALLAAGIGAFVPCCIGWALNTMRSIMWNTAGYYIEYDNPESSEEKEADTQQEDHNENQAD